LRTVKALQGKTPNELRELDEQFAAFQQVVTSRTPHLSSTGSVEGTHQPNPPPNV
jgi:hypothetical protein